MNAGYLSGDLILSNNAIFYSYAFYLIAKHRFKASYNENMHLTSLWFFYASLISLYTGSFMPQNNQVLEKREGYRQIFYAAAMVDLALQLNWEGEQEAYSGESKNTALLYEYWLFFELRKIISSIENYQCIQASEKPFINTDNGLTISLSEGQTSCQAFLLPDLGTRVKLYYNRTFSKEEFSNTKYAGSYSRPFRPDYTLEVYPSDYLKPEDAIREISIFQVTF